MKLLVWHNHALIGKHDPRCGQLPPDLQAGQVPFHRRHEGNDLVVAENGQETRYPGGTWSAAGVDLACGYMADVGSAGCPRCETPS